MKPFFFRSLFGLLSLLLISCGGTPVQAPKETPAPDDPFLWLEDVDSNRALDWVRSHNESTLKELKSDARYDELFIEMKAVTTADDRIPAPVPMNDYVYNYWQDSVHSRGLWRRTSGKEYAKKNPTWETVLDVDDLSKKENKSYAWKGADCLAPERVRCLLMLSDGGGDAVSVREFDLTKKQFVPDGFSLPAAKTDVTWYGKDNLLVATDFGPKSLTLSGYPRILKLWRRGTPLSQAKTLKEGEESDVGISPVSWNGADHTTAIIVRSKTFYEDEIFSLAPDEKVEKLPLPIDFQVRLLHENRVIGLLRSDWKRKPSSIKTGSIIAFPLESPEAQPAENLAEVIYSPGPKTAVTSVGSTKEAVLITALDNVRGRFYFAYPPAEKKGGASHHHPAADWKLKKYPFPDHGTISIAGTDEMSDRTYVLYQSFLTPSTLYRIDKDGHNPHPQLIRRLAERFDASDYAVEQFEATSKDKTKIPYFVVRPKKLGPEKDHPTLLYGYGGFNAAMVPAYLESVGPAWLARNGIYVLANIRGGGEFGPGWHKAALKTHRQVAFDDFFAVAEDLINHRKITTSKGLGIMGGSNGGLLMGAAFTQRPELFSAVVCQVPLLDMLRYHHLLAGNSWIAEYGNPDDAIEGAYLKTYSPYQHLKKDKPYPRVFFMTSTRDDRVHPGHARKMAAKMESYGMPFLYFERIEGGHGGSVTPVERAENLALVYTYLLRQLGPE